MHAVELRDQTKISAVVHDESWYVWCGHFCPRTPAQLARLLQHHARIPALVAILQQCASTRDKFLRESGQVFLRGKERGIHAGVKAGNENHAAVSFFPFFARNRSMNPVSKLPARKSRSARILRCSGIDVNTPSTINISSARVIRETASLRSLPRTISLLIRES